jgi:molybdate transport system substrate-binding protein
MSPIKFRPAALSAIAVAALASSAANAATKINVAVAANFTATVTQLISTFKLLYPGTDVTFTSDSSANLQAAIINHTAVYDLFLSADKTRPQQLATTYPTLVIGQPFLYAVGELELWSPTVNISAGLPSPLAANIVLADPNKAPYGTAAAQVLSTAPWSIPWVAGGTYPPAGTAHVFTKSNISLTYSAIKTGAYPYGFIAQSSICKLVSGVKTFSSGYHHTYPYTDAAHKHDEIAQYAIQIVNAARTPAQNTELTNFISFMTTNATGKSIIQSYCYSLTL